MEAHSTLKDWRPIQSWRLRGKAHDDGGKWSLFLGLPTCNILSVRIGLGKAHDHSLFVHSSCMFNVRMRYVCWSMLCMYEICIWMNVQCHAMYVCDIYIDTWIQCMYEIYILWMYVGMQCMYEICMSQNG